MELGLPDFKDHECLELSLCGVVGAGDAEVNHDHGDWIACYGPADVPTYLAVVPPFPKSPDHSHIHLKLTKAEWFGDRQPKANCDTETILNLLRPHFGKRLEVYIDAAFLAPEETLAPLLRADTLRSNVAGVAVRLVGGVLEVMGTPVHTITWRHATATLVDIRLQARATLVFADEYIDQCLSMVEGAIRQFAFKEPRNA